YKGKNIPIPTIGRLSGQGHDYRQSSRNTCHPVKIPGREAPKRGFLVETDRPQPGSPRALLTRFRNTLAIFDVWTSPFPLATATACSSVFSASSSWPCS